MFNSLNNDKVNEDRLEVENIKLVEDMNYLKNDMEKKNRQLESIIIEKENDIKDLRAENMYMQSNLDYLNRLYIIEGKCVKKEHFNEMSNLLENKNEDILKLQWEKKKLLEIINKSKSETEKNKELENLIIVKENDIKDLRAENMYMQSNVDYLNHLMLEDEMKFTIEDLKEMKDELQNKNVEIYRLDMEKIKLKERIDQLQCEVEERNRLLENITIEEDSDIQTIKVENMYMQGDVDYLEYSKSQFVKDTLKEDPVFYTINIDSFDKNLSEKERMQLNENGDDLRDEMERKNKELENIIIEKENDIKDLRAENMYMQSNIDYLNHLMAEDDKKYTNEDFKEVTKTMIYTNDELSRLNMEKVKLTELVDQLQIEMNEKYFVQEENNIKQIHAGNVSVAKISDDLYPSTLTCNQTNMYYDMTTYNNLPSDKIILLEEIDQLRNDIKVKRMEMENMINEKESYIKDLYAEKLYMQSNLDYLNSEVKKRRECLLQENNSEIIDESKMKKNEQCILQFDRLKSTEKVESSKYQSNEKYNNYGRLGASDVDLSDSFDAKNIRTETSQSYSDDGVFSASSSELLDIVNIHNSFVPRIYGKYVKPINSNLMNFSSVMENTEESELLTDLQKELEKKNLDLMTLQDEKCFLLSDVENLKKQVLELEDGSFNVSECKAKLEFGEKMHFNDAESIVLMNKKNIFSEVCTDLDLDIDNADIDMLQLRNSQSILTKEIVELETEISSTLSHIASDDFEEHLMGLISDISDINEDLRNTNCQKLTLIDEMRRLKNKITERYEEFQITLKEKDSIIDEHRVEKMYLESNIEYLSKLNENKINLSDVNLNEVGFDLKGVGNEILKLKCENKYLRENVDTMKNVISDKDKELDRLTNEMKNDIKDLYAEKLYLESNLKYINDSLSQRKDVTHESMSEICNLKSFNQNKLAFETEKVILITDIQNLKNHIDQQNKEFEDIVKVKDDNIKELIVEKIYLESSVEYLSCELRRKQKCIGEEDLKDIIDELRKKNKKISILKADRSNLLDHIDRMKNELQQKKIILETNMKLQEFLDKSEEENVDFQSNAIYLLEDSKNLKSWQEFKFHDNTPLKNMESEKINVFENHLNRSQSLNEELKKQLDHFRMAMEQTDIHLQHLKVSSFDQKDSWTDCVKSLKDEQQQLNRKIDDILSQIKESEDFIHLLKI